MYKTSRSMLIFSKDMTFTLGCTVVVCYQGDPDMSHVCTCLLLMTFLSRVSSLEFSSMIGMYSYDLVRTLLQYVCTQHLRIFIHLCRCTCLLPHMLTHGLLCFGLNFPRPMSMTWEFSPVHCMYWYATGENSKPGIPCTLYMYAPVVNSPMCIPWTCVLATIENSKPCMPCTFTCMLQL